VQRKPATKQTQEEGRRSYKGVEKTRSMRNIYS
jgi:hypothetical protein